MRAIPVEFDPAAVAAIDGRLDGIGHAGAHVLLAIESGSRAWGFPSPDSDYDCRFLFVRREDDYLTPWPKRDVIETPLEGDLDVNGWELGKALKLLLKGNAVVIEWLMSPIVYRGDPAFRTDMRALARDHADARCIARHYLHLGERQRSTYFADGKAVKLKKIFYALRPAAALRWLRLHPDAAIAPMHFPTLMAECDPPADLAALVDELIARKAVTRELGETPLPAAVERFIDTEFTIAAAMPRERTTLSGAAREAAEALFRKWVRA
ncbi:MAG TPA: nucleotidyltransferase domain-containing protein [Allosphingosinicella sp.]|nr:nucleotidyltransferase domain-containing protein [Allosphingosinicella sp.]